MATSLFSASKRNQMSVWAQCVQAAGNITEHPQDFQPFSSLWSRVGKKMQQNNTNLKDLLDLSCLTVC